MHFGNIHRWSCWWLHQHLCCSPLTPARGTPRDSSWRRQWRVDRVHSFQFHGPSNERSPIVIYYRLTHRRRPSLPPSSSPRTRPHADLHSKPQRRRDAGPRLRAPAPTCRVGCELALPQTLSNTLSRGPNRRTCKANTRHTTASCRSTVLRQPCRSECSPGGFRARYLVAGRHRQ